MTALPRDEPVGSPRSADAYGLLAPYLPRLVVDWLADAPGERHRAIAGSMVHVDISGFTRLTEQLSRRGKIGAELLADAINECFTKLLVVAYANGGSLLKFGGDALLLFFSSTEHERRAARAAIGMRAALREFGGSALLGARVALRMSVGVHSDEFDFFLVGGRHRELLVAGRGATATVEMETSARAGEIVVSAGTAGALQPGVVGAPLGAGYLLRRAPREGPDLSASSPRPRRDVDLAEGVPEALRQHLLGGLSEAEHRSVTIAFIRFEGTDELLARSGARGAEAALDALVADVQRAAAAHGVAFLGTDIDRDGGKVILTAGAPTTSGDDDGRMLRALREVADGERAIPVRIGVTRGSVFVGDIGPPYRRTFTVMGDAVNLAARLMARARHGQILTTVDTLERSRAAFESSELEPFHVKGKAKPVVARSVGALRSARRQAAGQDSALYGRRHELEVLSGLVRRAVAGRGGVVELTGEPGVGKSRLVAELWRDAEDLRRLQVTCDSYESAIPYLAFGRLLRELLAIPAGTSARRQASALAAGIARTAPDLSCWAPLIGAVVGVAVPDTAETAQLEERFRRSRLVEVTAALCGRALAGPTLIVFEDAHWMDEGSVELLGRLAEDAPARPWLVCVTRNEHDGGFSLPEGLGRRLRLAPLDAQAAAELLRATTRDAPLAPHLAAALAERVGGNPLFLRELVASRPAVAEVEALPDSVEALIAARMDRLAPAERSVLRRCSVLGRSFPADQLAFVLDEVPPSEDERWARLAGFLTLAEGRVSFEHALVRDVAYGGLSYRVRRELHARAADAIGGQSPDALEEHAALLSLHYLCAQRYEEAWSFAVAAGRRSEAVWADAEAIEHYERALEAARHLEARPPDLIGVTEALGDARWRLGMFAPAKTAFRSARRAVGGDAVAQARLMLKLARVQGMLDRYANSLSWITRALGRLEGDDSPPARRERAQLLVWYGRFCQEQGRHPAAIAWCRRAVAEAEAAGEKDALAHALRILDWAQMDLGRLEEPTNLTRSLALYEELGDLPSQASVLNMLGGIAYWKGRWADALDYYASARSTVRRTGNEFMAAFCANNIAEIALNQGRLGEAEELFGEALHVWKAAGYRSGVAFATCNLARIHAEKGEHSEAVRLLEESLGELQAIGARSEELEARARLAECLILGGHAEEALAIADAALAQERALGGQSAQLPILQRVRGSALAYLGRPEAARQALELSLSAGRARGAEYEVALTLLGLAALAGPVGDPSLEECAGEGRAILDRLGVVSPTGALQATGT